MHYRNKRPAAIGDEVVYNHYGATKVGVVVEACPGSTTCNLTVQPTGPRDTVTAAECIRTDDIADASYGISATETVLGGDAYGNPPIANTSGEYTVGPGEQ